MLLIELSETGVSEKDLWGELVTGECCRPWSSQLLVVVGRVQVSPRPPGETGEEGEGSQYIDRHLLPFLPNSPVACV